MPARRPLAWVVALCSVAAALAWASSAVEPLTTLIRHPETVPALVGIGATAALLATRPEERVAIVGAAGIPVFVMLTGFAFVYTWAALPLTFDPHLLAADRALGIVPAYPLGQWFQEHRVLAVASWLLYMTMPFEVALLYAAAARGKAGAVAPLQVLGLCAAVGLAGAVLYAAYPATGPRHAFAGFPHPPPPVALEPLAAPPGAPRNAMPSLHLAWALVLWRLARGGPGWLRAAAMGWLVGTVLATFGLGEHYAIDLVVAVPFALVMEAVCRKRLSAFVVANAAAVVAWLVVLRSPEPLASSTIWLGVLATLALSYGLARSLSRPREA